MKKLGLLVILACVCGMGYADTWTYTVDAVQAKSYTSDVIQASGYIERIEFNQEADSTCTVVVATYTPDNATAIETFASLSNNTDTSKTVRPRVVGTGTTGTALTYVAASGTTNVLQQVVVPYERMMIGGNSRVKITQGAVTGLTNTLKVVVFYEPIKK